MKALGIVCSVILVLLLHQLSGCDEEEKKEIYLEGAPIPGVEIFFPLGLYDAEPLMPKISPDGTKLLFTGPASVPEWKGLWVMDLETQEKTLLHPEGRLGDWAPDSEWVAFNLGTQVFRIKIDATELTQLTFPFEVEVNGLTYSGSSFLPDWSTNNTIAYYLSIDVRTEEQGTRIINTSGGEIKKCIDLGYPDWNPTGEKLIGVKGISSAESRFNVYDVISDTIERTIQPFIGHFRSPKFSPDNRNLIFSNSDGIYLMDSDGILIKRIIPSHLYGEKRKNPPSIYSAYPSWHPDGKHIIYEHFKITRTKRLADETRVEGTIRFYKVNADSALQTSNLGTQ